MSRRSLDVACVAGCTVAFPWWWRMSRWSLILLVCFMSAYSGLFEAESWLTVTAFSAVMMDVVSLLLFLALTGACTAFSEACVYPSLDKNRVARDYCIYGSALVGLAAYVYCGWRATGFHFLYPGLAGLVAGLAHFGYAAIFEHDHRKLVEELGNTYNHGEMGSWLYNKNMYPPDDSMLDSRWDTVRVWMATAGYQLKKFPNLSFNESVPAFPGGYNLLKDRPVVLGDLGVSCRLTWSDVEQLVGSKVPLVLTIEEKTELDRVCNQADIEGGNRAVAERVVRELMNKQPTRQNDLRYNIHDLGTVVDNPGARNIRRNTVVAAFAFVASLISFLVPSAGSTIVAGVFALTLAYFANIDATSRWVRAQVHLRQKNAGIDPGHGMGYGMPALYVVTGLAVVSAAWPSETSSFSGIVIGICDVTLGMSPMPVVLVTVAGHLISLLCVRREQGFWIQPDGFTHGYNIFMRWSRERGPDGENHYCFEGDAYVVGKYRLMFSASGGELLETKNCNDQNRGEFHVNQREHSCLVQVG